MMAPQTGLRFRSGGGGGGLDDVPDIDGVVFDKNIARRALTYVRPHRGRASDPATPARLRW